MPISTDIKGSKVFVTGADGFIGSHLVERLVSLGASVRGLCYYNSLGSIGNLVDLAPETLASVDLVFGDIRDRSLLSAQMDGFDYIFHLASLISIPHSYVAAQSYVDTNICGLLNILEILKSRSFTRFVNTSTSEVYGTAITRPIDETHPLQGQSPYSASKIAADHFVEAFCRSFEMPLVSLRPFNTFGPRQSVRAIIPTIITQLINSNQKNLKLGDLTPLRDFNYIGNTVDAFVDIMFHDAISFGQAYNAGSGSTVSILETVNTIQQQLRLDKEIITDPRKKRPKNSEVFELISDNRKLNEATGWSPKVSFKDGIKNTIQWHLDKPNNIVQSSQSVIFD